MVSVFQMLKREYTYFGIEYGLSYESEIGKYTRAVFTLPIIYPDGKNGVKYALTVKEEE